MKDSDYYIQDNADIEDKKLSAAQNLYNNGNYSGALKLYLDIVNTSYSFRVYFETGRCYYKLNDTDNAIFYFNRSIELEANKNPSYQFLGNIYFKKGETNKAIEYWITAHSFKPDDENLCLNLATSYFSKDMRFQATHFYQKFLKYAKDKNSIHYLEVKQTLNSFMKDAEVCYQKALRAISAKDTQTAIQALTISVKTYPLKFDSNFLLGKLFLEQKNYKDALIYFKQAFTIDKKSLDVLQIIPVIMTNLGDIAGAYCALKRLIPLVIRNQKEYLKVITTLKQLETNINPNQAENFLLNADEYFSNNDYLYAFFEYENYILMGNHMSAETDLKLQKIRRFINPEENIIRTCFDKGSTFHSMGAYEKSNKYFSKIMTLSTPNSADYKLAKSRLVNV